MENKSEELAKLLGIEEIYEAVWNCESNFSHVRRFKIKEEAEQWITEYKKYLEWKVK